MINDLNTQLNFSTNSDTTSNNYVDCNIHLYVKKKKTTVVYRCSKHKFDFFFKYWRLVDVMDRLDLRKMGVEV